MPLSLTLLGANLFDLTQSSAWAQPLFDFVRMHGAWAPAVVFALAFAESLAVVSLFVPATFLLVGIGGLVGASDLEFWQVWLGATAGAALGDWVSYWIGFKLEHTARRTWPLARYPDLYDGVWSVFIGRFFGPLRALVPLIAGVFRMPLFPFQMANVASAMVWAFVLLAPSFAAMQVLQY
jgi:membrane protein DedA with SNARE-associated domain